VEPATILRWSSEWPNANVGIATGSKSGTFVLDVDPRNGGDESLEALQQDIGELPETVTVRTESGGRHFYFQFGDTDTFRNSASKLGPGLDIRAEGGFVVAPPSLHISGNRYAWIN
jgi:putative DNA primase/helicase